MNVYCLYFPNGKRYIGVESRTGDRIRSHRLSFGRKSQYPQPVCRAIAKYGWDNCSWRYLFKDISRSVALAAEILFIKIHSLQDNQFGYNVSRGGEQSAFGVKHGPESLARRRACRIGKKATPESKAKVSKSLMGHAVSAASRIKMSMAKIGSTPWNRGLHGMTKPNITTFRLGGMSPIKGRIMLPAGPNGESRYFRPEQLI